MDKASIRPTHDMPRPRPTVEGKISRGGAGGITSHGR